MNIENIAIIRATDIIPTEGIVVPISEANYIKKNRNEPFSIGISELLKRKGKITPIDFSQLDNPNYIEEKNKEIDKITNEYIPYTSDYNSMLLFSLNGLVPDDKEAGFGNNTFSNKPCAIIDSLSSHINEVISLNPTDTAIKGTLKLSSDAIIFIEENFYNNLSVDDKNKLSKFHVKIFSGDLKEAVDSYLINSQRYTCENLSLSSSTGGVLDSPTSDELKATIKNIAKERNIATAYHFDILLRATDDMDKLKSVENEHENIGIIREFYQNEFYRFLFDEMQVDEQLKYCLLNYNSEVYVDELCDVIDNFGLDNYKKICDRFNDTLEAFRQKGQLPTPQEIIDSINRGETIDLCSMIRGFNLEEYTAARTNYQTKEILIVQEIENEKDFSSQKGRKM